MHSVSVTHRRGQRRRRACLQSGVRARCVSGQPADGQPVASDSSTAAKLFDVSACCRVRACALLASRARVVRACRACSARVCSCARQASQPRKSSIAAKHRKQSTSLFVFARAFLNFACLKLHRVPEAETRTVKPVAPARSAAVDHLLECRPHLRQHAPAPREATDALPISSECRH